MLTACRLLGRDVLSGVAFYLAQDAEGHVLPDSSLCPADNAAFRFPAVRTDTLERFLVITCPSTRSEASRVARTCATSAALHALLTSLHTDASGDGKSLVALYDLAHEQRLDASMRTETVVTIAPLGPPLLEAR